MNNKVFVLTGITLMLLLLYFGYETYLSEDTNDYRDTSYHAHADFAVYMKDHFIDFSQDKYMSTPDSILSENGHLHDEDGQVLHYHKEGFTLSDFFESLGIEFNNNCFIQDRNNSYCDNSSYKIFIVVNGNVIVNGKDYVGSDLDRILVAYVENESEALNLFNNVSDVACIQSEKCPERGEPSDESSCAGTTCSVSLNDI